MPPTFRNEALFGRRPDWSPPPSPDFVVIWADPADADLSWDRNEMHHAAALAPLAIDVVAATTEGFDIGYRYFDVPLRVRFTAQNGYAYFAPVWGVPDAEIPGLQQTMTERFRAFARESTAYWAEKLPELRAIYGQMASVDVDGLAGPELAVAWREAWAGLRTAWGIHFVIIRGAQRISEDLADLYRRHVPDAPDGAGYQLLQGRVDILHEVELGIEGLAAVAAAAPAVRERLARPPLPSVDELAGLDGGEDLTPAMKRFLAVHGHLGQASTNFAEASWADEPTRLVAELAKRLDDPPEAARNRRQRLLAESEAMADDVRARLRDRPSDLAEFETLLSLAREVGPLTESHNYWIDRMSLARLRTLAIRIGRRLALEDVIDEPLDVLYLRRDEIETLVVSPRPMRATVAERRAEHARQQALIPPRSIGRVDAAPTVAEPPAAGTPSNELRGTGASAGVVRGPARVVLGLDGFDRIGRGDIIVAPATNPAWVPVFTVAAGLVTNTGGVLAHAAVVAREFGLPAVVGVAGATSRIADGQLIEIDGTAGTVRLIGGDVGQ